MAKYENRSAPLESMIHAISWHALSEADSMTVQKFCVMGWTCDELLDALQDDAERDSMVAMIFRKFENNIDCNEWSINVVIDDFIDSIGNEPTKKKKFIIALRKLLSASHKSHSETNASKYLTLRYKEWWLFVWLLLESLKDLPLKKSEERLLLHMWAISNLTDTFLDHKKDYRAGNTAIKPSSLFYIKLLTTLGYTSMKKVFISPHFTMRAVKEITKAIETMKKNRHNK